MSISIKLHSVTDLITNSSTTIYTNSQASGAACERMINAFLDALGMKERCSDMFSLSVGPCLVDLIDRITDRMLFNSGGVVPLSVSSTYKDEAPYEREKVVRELVRSFISGDVPKPNWFISLEARAHEVEGNTYLNILPLQPKYNELSWAIYAFLYSTVINEEDK